MVMNGIFFIVEQDRMRLNKSEWFIQSINGSEWYLEYKTRANNNYSTRTRANDTAMCNVLIIFDSLIWNDQEMIEIWPRMKWKYHSFLLGTVSLVLICHSWMVIEWDFLKQSHPVNLGYCPAPSHLVLFIYSQKAICSCLLYI